MIFDNQDATECEEYLSSVLNWEAAPYVGRSPLDTSVRFGPFTLAELESSVKDAADAAGFFAYSHKGARKTATSCSVKFGCDCARKRHGKERACIEAKDRDFTKDMDEVVRDTSGKRKKQRKGGGCLKAHTQRSRSKAKECTWSMCLKAVVENGTWTPNSRTFWTLNGDPRCINQFVHSHHCRSPHKRKISNNIKEYIRDHGETMMVHQLIDAVYRKFRVEISSDQVKYILKCNNIRNKERSRGSCRAGGAGDAVEFLLHNTESEVVLLLNNCATGKWFTGAARLSEAKSTEILLSEYEKMKPKKFSAIDETRVIDIEGDRFLVWSAAWNYKSEMQLFSAYPEVVQLDCMHGVTTSTDGFNAIGIDGNGHNIQVMRAFIASQDSNVFCWIFRVAFPALVRCSPNIRVFFTDGCVAMNSELEAACCPLQQFPNAKLFRCMFHLITKAFDDKFRMGDGWQANVKKLLYRLRRCESEEEFDACSEFVMRKIAAMETLGPPQSALRAEVLHFVKRRINCSDIWVLKNQLKLPTRGCMATARVEGTHGHDRTTERINARNSWYTSMKRHVQGSDRRHRAKQAWSRRQLGSQLLRNPMNAEHSAFKREDLDALDAVLLPWALETLEEQGLLAKNMRVVFTKTGYSPETQSIFRALRRDADRPHSAEFAVWVEGDDESDDGDALNDDQTELDDDSSNSSSSDESSDDSRYPRKKQNRDDEESDDADAALNPVENEDCDDDFDADDFIDKCQHAPLPAQVIFRWQKVRIVTLVPQYGDDQKLTGKYMWHCSCGFPYRIGVCCRHILAALYHVILNIAAARRQRQNEDSASDDDLDIPSIDWSACADLCNLQELCNQSLCNKIKYHAVLHEKGLLFKKRPVFRPTCAKELAQEYLATFNPNKSEIPEIPTNGLPPDADDESPEGYQVAIFHFFVFALYCRIILTSYMLQNQPKEHPAAKKMPLERDARDTRDLIPTLFNCSTILDSNWKFTNRFQTSDKNAARKRIREILLEMETEIRAMATHHVAESDLTRKYSNRDRFNGTASRK